ncbi:3'-to-5' oligoribonuclease A [Desulfocucumis palustris]|uniref:3'-to-5' oligoribonuclease A n=1 Tax=Desulfocucumis palustris TaxID=1898651 RepID=A0A2L2X8W8_9FIRM|nr:bifunctional oligoribonuclease/PAP phosphatase NrnA [Desulfocucumis palustris]GBF32677.1 3'-to-5' oligoribonuclease A [Desulfocucumis palustris]
MNSLTEIAGVLRNSRKVILCGHVMPDGDCLGSVAALGAALEQMGKDVTLASPDPVPEIYGFLPVMGKFLIGEKPLSGEYDTFIILDCSVPERLGKLKSLLERDMVFVNIDHHKGPGDFAGYNYIDDSAAATGEIVMDLIDLLNAGITGDIAVSLYVALSTDTGSFQYENTTPGTLKKAARLMEAGIHSTWININLYEERPLVILRVMEKALENMEISPCGKVAWTSIDKSTLNSMAARDEHTDGLINIVRTIKGVEIAIFFREITSGKFKVSFRSKSRVDVRLLAGKFGGGGHVRASGCVLEGDVDGIKKMVVAAALKEI